MSAPMLARRHPATPSWRLTPLHGRFKGGAGASFPLARQGGAISGWVLSFFNSLRRHLRATGRLATAFAENRLKFATAGTWSRRKRPMDEGPRRRPARPFARRDDERGRRPLAPE